MEVIGSTVISTFAKYLLSKKPNDKKQEEGGLSKCQKKVRNFILQKGLKLNMQGDYTLYLTFKNNETHLTFDKEETQGYYLVVHKFSKKEHGDVSTIIFNEYIAEVIDVVSLINEIDHKKEFTPWEDTVQDSSFLGFTGKGQIKLQNSLSGATRSFVSMINFSSIMIPQLPVDAENYKKRGVERYTVYEKRGYLYLWDRKNDKSEPLTVENIFIIRPQTSALIGDAKIRRFFEYYEPVGTLAGFETSKIAVQVAVKKLLNVDMVFQCRKFSITPYNFRDYNRIGTFYNYILFNLGSKLIPSFKIDFKKRHTKTVNQLVDHFKIAIIPPEKVTFNNKVFDVSRSYVAMKSKYDSKCYKYDYRMKKIENSMMKRLNNNIDFRHLSIKRSKLLTKTQKKKYYNIKPSGSSELQDMCFKAHLFQKIVPKRNFDLNDVEHLFDAFYIKGFIPNFSKKYRIGHIMRNEIFHLLELFQNCLIAE